MDFVKDSRCSEEYRPRSRKRSRPLSPAVTVSPFVSETDVRQAITRQQKIFIGPKTTGTPSARDLGVAHEIFVETDLAPAPSKSGPAGGVLTSRLDY